jgi:hypothetical protein
MLTIKEIEAMAVSINKTPRTAAQGTLVVTALSLKRIKAMREWDSWRVRNHFFYCFTNLSILVTGFLVPCYVQTK